MQGGGSDRFEAAPRGPARSTAAVGRAAFDLALFMAAFALSWLIVRGGASPGIPWAVITAQAFVFAAVSVGGLSIMGAYRSRRDRLDSAMAAQVGLGIGLAALTLALALAAGLPTAQAWGELAAAAPLAVCAALFTRFRKMPRRVGKTADGKARTLIVGSRDGAAAVVRLVDSRPDIPHALIGCVDDTPDRSHVEGLPVLGRIADIARIVEDHQIASVIVAAPAQDGLVRRVQAQCVRAAGPGGVRPRVRIIPSLDDLLRGVPRTPRIRDLRLEDLLQRTPGKADVAVIAPHLAGRTVLVTGAGGSIGSELCRQIAEFQPELLLLLGHGENSLFAIERELRSEYPACKTEIVLADVADGHRVSALFGRYRPHVVFHAAAHKHVPILESNVCEAVRNNVFGTHAVALAAAAAGVAKFVMISTDKAVNPQSVMGATKRLAESICQSFERRTGTEFVSVRFGNVLGSRGSVLDVFAEQIESGGPLTITHPEMERFFMTIPEAVELVLEAMAIGRDGQVFVMDMGKPVSVITLAENLVSLSGLRPYEDIDIVFTGVRPGEKLREELLTVGEGENPTVHERLFVAQQERIGYDRLVDGLDQLKKAMVTSDAASVVECLKALVPSFAPGPHHHAHADDEISAGDPMGFSNGVAPVIASEPSNGKVAPTGVPNLTEGEHAADSDVADTI